ncbi:hypothetical protein [Xanthobacter oligotrophicus]|uniref:hypothetical protein n=1 Tax=Xanthobacter oligotrophicus TaxID=2607286 RepID=UPI0011F159A1|nr:hypothetical protein [Xanthobacter oligotrophicus]MCG5236732.1 hypothetical protein [Xanthobacter oligotrophicus]
MAFPPERSGIAAAAIIKTDDLDNHSLFEVIIHVIYDLINGLFPVRQGPAPRRQKLHVGAGGGSTQAKALGCPGALRAVARPAC